MKMCVFGLNHSNLSRGALPRAPGWLCRPTKPKPETRNPAAEWAKPETQAAAEKRNPKPKPGRNPVRGRRIVVGYPAPQIEVRGRIGGTTLFFEHFWSTNR